MNLTELCVPHFGGSDNIKNRYERKRQITKNNPLSLFTSHGK